MAPPPEHGGGGGIIWSGGPICRFESTFAPMPLCVVSAGTVAAQAFAPKERKKTGESTDCSLTVTSSRIVLPVLGLDTAQYHAAMIIVEQTIEEFDGGTSSSPTLRFTSIDSGGELAFLMTLGAGGGVTAFLGLNVTIETSSNPAGLGRYDNAATGNVLANTTYSATNCQRAAAVTTAASSMTHSFYYGITYSNSNTTISTLTAIAGVNVSPAPVNFPGWGGQLIPLPTNGHITWTGINF